MDGVPEHTHHVIKLDQIGGEKFLQVEQDYLTVLEYEKMLIIISFKTLFYRLKVGCFEQLDLLLVIDVCTQVVLIGPQQ